MSPVIAAGALASVRAVRAEAHARAKMHATTAQLKRRLLQAGVPLMSVETHIMPVHVGNGALCKAMADELLQRGIYVQPINYPSVPKGGDLLRFTASPKHTQEHCDAFVDNLIELCGRHGLLVAPSDCAFVEMPAHVAAEDIRNYGMNQAVWCSEGSNCCVLRRMAA
jgi:5-aminolevulinate synthase